MDAHLISRREMVKAIGAVLVGVHGAWSPMMKPVVQNLTMDDMIAIVAYTSSRMP